MYATQTSKRIHPRVFLPAVIRLGGKRFPVLDLSVGGGRARGSTDGLQVAATIPCEISFGSVSDLKSAPALAQIVRIDPEMQGFSAALKVEGEQSYAALAKYVEHGIAQELAAVTGSKNAILGTISHELKTPLNAIIGFSELALQNMHGALHPEHRSHFLAIHQSGKTLLSKVSNIIDYAESSGVLRPHYTRSSISSILDATANLVREKASRPVNVLVSSRVDDGRDEFVTDAALVVRVLGIFVDNAIQHGGAANIQISARDDAENIAFAVRDDGKGVAPGRAEKIFAAFESKGSNVHLASGDGVGVGLALSKRIAGSLGATVSLEPSSGRGAVFVLLVPRLS